MSKISTVLCVALLGHLVAGSAIAAAGNLEFPAFHRHLTCHT